jgi:hypothetical protein
MHRWRLVRPVLFVAALVATLTLIVTAEAATARRPERNAATDVRERLAELRRRVEAQSATARSRTQRERIAGEWWRSVPLTPKRPSR